MAFHVTTMYVCPFQSKLSHEMISWVCGKASQLRGTSIVIVMCLSDFNTYFHALYHQRHVFPVTACLQADENVQL